MEKPLKEYVGLDVFAHSLEQEKRFEEQDKKRKLGDLEAQTVDYDFINAPGYGLPPTSGMGLGIDRFTMILSGIESIKGVNPFPSDEKGRLNPKEY